MADRYKDRPFPADDYDRRGNQHAPAGGESDPLAELARLIGQTDPFAGMGRANQPVQPRGGEHERHQQPATDDYDAADYDAADYEAAADDGAPDDGPAAGPPPWMQRNAAPQAPIEDYPPNPVHPLRRYATPLAAAPEPDPEYHQPQPFPDADHDPDPSRYDDALYGQVDSGTPHEPAYRDDRYAYQDGYDEMAEEPARKRGGGMITVVVVLALAVVGTGAAFAYRTYIGSPRSGEPPIIRADAGPTKIVPAPSDGTIKVPDRMVSGDGAEKIVPREETPVDVNAKSGPRVVLPQLNPNPNPPSVTGVATGGPAPAGVGNGTMPSSEPRRIRTLAVRGDQPDAAAAPVNSAQSPTAKPAPTTRAPAAAAANANASSANVPLSLTPQPGQPAPAAPRVATANPAQPASTSGGGNYLVQVSSQKNEADAQASYKALQSKFPAVLGSRPPVIKRADLGEKGVFYRAMVGPFNSTDEASQFCGSLKTAGGQCVVQRN